MSDIDILNFSLSENLKKADLITKLSELQTKLSTITQDLRPRGLREIATELIKKRFLYHSDKDVRVIVLCCLADVLRIYAPDAPFSDSDMCQVFEGFVTQLKGLSTNATDSVNGVRIYYILHSLSTVKSCVVPVILSQAQVPGACDIVYSLFETLITSAHTGFSENILEHICSILESCLEEMTEVDSEILEILLSPIIPANKTENPLSFAIVDVVIRSCAPHIERYLSKFINQILVGSVNETNDTDIAENIYPIIYELHKISPDLLNQIVPNICIQLDAEEEEIRLKSVKLVGRLFASTHANYGVEFKIQFNQFLKRFGDISIEIRSQMIEIGSLIMNRHKHLLSQVEDHMKNRLQDIEFKVRQNALNKLLTIGIHDVTKLKQETIEAMAARAKDKKMDIVQLAMNGLAKIYLKNLSSCLPGIDTIINAHNEVVGSPNKKRKSNSDNTHSHVQESYRSVESLIPPETFSRCSFIPGFIIKCWGYPDTTVKNLTLQLLQEYILPRIIIHDSDSESDDRHTKTVKSKASETVTVTSKNEKNINHDELNSVRMTALLLLFENLDEQDRLSLGYILSCKTKMRKDVSTLVESIYEFQSSKTKGRNSRRKSSIQNRNSITENSVNMSVTEMEGDGLDNTLSITKSVFKIYQQLQFVDKKNPNLGKLAEFKDKNILRLLSRCLGPDGSIAESCKYREEVKQRLDSKSPLGQYCGYIYDLAGYLFINNEMLCKFLRYIIQLKQNVSTIPKSAIVNLNDLTLMLGKHVAGVFKNTSHSLTSLVACSYNNFKEINTELASLNTLATVLNMTAKTIAEDTSIPNLYQLLQNMKEALSNCTDITYCDRLSEALLRIELHFELQKLNRSHDEIASIPKNFSACISLMKELSSPEYLSLDNPSLSYHLQILSSLIKLPPAITQNDINLFKSFSSLIVPVLDNLKVNLLQFVQEKLLDATVLKEHLQLACQQSVVTSKSDKRKRSSKENDQNNSDNLSGRFFDSVCTGLSLWTSIIMTEESMIQWIRNNCNEIDIYCSNNNNNYMKGRREAGGGGEGGEISEGLAKLIQELFVIMLSDGQTVGDNISLIQSSENEEIDEISLNVMQNICKRIANATTLCFIGLLKLKSMSEFLSVEHWKCIAWKFLDTSDPIFRRNLVEMFSMLIQTHPIHPKFLAFQSLLACDEKYSKRAADTLANAMSRLRTNHEILNSRVLLLSDHTDENDPSMIQLKKKALDNMPETILPYVLYLLSYHPDFPTTANLEGDGDKEKVKRILTSVKMIINNLMNSLKRDSNNLSYLLKQVNTIVSDYVDCYDTANIGLHFVSRLTITVLKEKIKTSENVSVYPGEIILPMTLFQRIPHKSKHHLHKGKYENGIDEHENTHDIFEKVFQDKVSNKTGGARKNNILSPKKQNRVSGTEKNLTKPLKKVKEDNDVPPPPIVSNRPVRSTRVSVNYKEKEETEREALQWEQAQAVAVKERNSLERVRIGSPSSYSGGSNSIRKSNTAESYAPMFRSSNISIKSGVSVDSHRSRGNSGSVKIANNAKISGSRFSIYNKENENENSSENDSDDIILTGTSTLTGTTAPPIMPLTEKSDIPRPLGLKKHAVNLPLPTKTNSKTKLILKTKAVIVSSNATTTRSRVTK